MKLKIKDSFKKAAIDYFSDNPVNSFFFDDRRCFVKAMLNYLDIIIDTEKHNSNDLDYDYKVGEYYYCNEWLEPVGNYKKRITTYETE